MGKKKAQKMKQLSVAIAIGEASSTGDETGRKQSQPQTPRKRGRPRKMVEKTELEDKKKEEAIQQPATSLAAEEGPEKSLKKGKSSLAEERGCQQVDSSACVWVAKEEGVSQEKQPSRTRRARRKSKPTKSS